MTPTPKVAAAGIAGALSVILVWIMGLTGLDIPAEVAASLTTILAFLAGYLKAPGTGDVADERGQGAVTIILWVLAIACVIWLLRFLF